MQTLTHATLLAVALQLATMASPVAAVAADKARPAAAAKSTDRILTPAQLRDCVSQKERLQSQTNEVLKAKAEIDVDKAEIDRSGAAINDERPLLDRTSAEAVDAFNGKVDQRDKLVDAYQARVTAYNAKADNVKAAQDAYESACLNRRYDDRDLDDLKRRKK